MNLIGLYPTWLEPGISSGWVVGVIATIHVLFSHAAVGAAIFFAGLAVYADRANKPEYLEFIRRYGMFLLVFSYVLGSITGPGIWYSTTVASPRGISALIHSFVWKWPPSGCSSSSRSSASTCWSTWPARSTARRTCASR